jgi:hypothetical protein
MLPPQPGRTRGRGFQARRERRADASAGSVAGSPARSAIGLARRPDARSTATARARPSRVMLTEPSRSVRKIRAPAAASRASVEGAGCPYVFSLPALTTAARGRMAARNGSLVAVALPWWATLRASQGGPPPPSASTRAASMSSSMSPVSSSRCDPTVTSRTSEASLIRRPDPGAMTGTEPRGGHTTVTIAPSRSKRSPWARRMTGMPVVRATSRIAACPGPGPRMPFSASIETR